MTVGQLSMLTGLISSELVYSVPMRGKKTVTKLQFWPNFHIFGGSCTHPHYCSGPNFAGNSRPTVYAYMPNFIWNRLMCHLPGTKKQFRANLHFGAPVPSRVQKNPGFFKKAQPSGFFWVFIGFYWVLGFIGFFWTSRKK